MRNDTTRFILPLMFKKEIRTDNFVNAYLLNDRFPENEYITLVYRKPNNLLLNYKPAMTEQFKDIYIYYFSIPEDLKVTIDKFMNGKYSKFNPLSKETILKFWNVSKHSKLHNILYPKYYMHEITSGSLVYKKGEIWPKPNSIRETFIYNLNIK